jgi:hypothetical protein
LRNSVLFRLPYSDKFNVILEIEVLVARRHINTRRFLAYRRIEA